MLMDARRWRMSDPSIPDNLRQELVNELMSARRGVRGELEILRGGPVVNTNPTEAVLRYRLKG